MVVRFALASLSLLGFSSCVTHDWVAKAASGRVIDAESGREVAGVAIYRVLENQSVFIGTTDSQGRFAIPAASRTSVTLPMPGDPGYLSSLLFRAPDYRDEKVDCGTFAGEVVGQPAPSLPSLTVKLHKRPNKAMHRSAAPL